jgi:hypothetical protein
MTETVTLSERSAAPKPAVSKPLPPTVIGCRPGTAASMVSATSRSAVPLASLTRSPTSSPWRFSIKAWPMKQSLASLPLPLRKSLASGSVVEACVSLVGCSPWKSRSPLRPSAAGLPLPSFGRKLFIELSADGRK